MSSNEVVKKLSKLREKRGYLLPHHGLMAISSPELLEAYDSTYTYLTLKKRYMSEYQKEIVWLVILISTGESIATHHLDRLSKCGGSKIDVNNATTLAAWADGSKRFNFVNDNWGKHLKNFNGIDLYRSGLNDITKNFKIEKWLIEISLAACHQCHRRWFWVREHIIGAYKENVDENTLAEALSLAMFPGGVPNFVDACDIWRALIKEKTVSASEPYKLWAKMSKQNGFEDKVKGL